MLTLGQIENSEYNLLGAMSEDDFLQAIDLSCLLYTSPSPRD
jgi:hypothetical protein